MDNNNLDSTKIGEQKVSNDAIKLSDVIEVIETDMDFRESNAAKKMFNGGGVAPQPQQPQLQPAQSKRNARIRIIEQPASKALRFRYECEGRSAGSIPGATSTPENKTFPTIQVVGYKGRAVVVVSCVTKDPPYRAHPHNLVGREGCKKGVCTLEIPTDTMTVHFSNLGIQCVKKKDIEQALRVREEIRVDPFRQGFSHRSQPTSIDLNAVRLCFQVFLEGNTPGKFSLPLEPVVSEPIYDKKAMSDLSIIKLSHCVSSVDGGREDIILLCEKVAKEDIQVRFFEENGDWEAFADFQPTQVHKQHAIWFRPPRYKTLEVTEPVKVFIQLRRPSDGAISEPLPFELWPLDSEPGALKRKRQKIENPGQILSRLKEHDTTGRLTSTFPMEMDQIKIEPRESTSPYRPPLAAYGGISPNYMSPQYISMQPTPSPDMMCQYQPNIGITSPHYAGNSPQYLDKSPQPQIYATLNDLGSISGQNTHMQWNIPTSATNEITLMYDLDNGIKQVNSEEINKLVENVQLQEISGDNLFSMSDIVASQEDPDMTDSMKRLINMHLEKHDA